MPAMMRPGKKPRRIAEKVLKHLDEDISMYKREAKEDRDLQDEVRKSKGMTMKKQGYNDRLDESLGMRHRGKKKQSMKDRRDESKGMEKARGKRAYSSVKSMDNYPQF